jgi:hypothetical protein
MTKTASQEGWSLRYSVSSTGFQFVTARSIDSNAHYNEYYLADSGLIIEGTANTCGFFDLPLSVVQLIRFWFGTITYEEYTKSLRNLNWPV